AALDLDGIGAARTQCIGREGERRFVRAATEGIDRVMLDQEQDIVWDRAVDPAKAQGALQRESLVVGAATQVEHVERSHNRRLTTARRPSQSDRAAATTPRPISAPGPAVEWAR